MYRGSPAAASGALGLMHAVFYAQGRGRCSLRGTASFLGCTAAAAATAPLLPSQQQQQGISVSGDLLSPDKKEERTHPQLRIAPATHSNATPKASQIQQHQHEQQQ